jgi:hypothetical protein
MKRWQIVLAILIPVLLMVLLTGGTGETRGLPGSDPPADGEQGAGPPDQPARIDALNAAPNQSDNASVRISGAALKPRESNVEWTGVGGAGGCIYASSGSASAVFNTPLYLPQGSVVRYLRMYDSDQDTSTNSTAWPTVSDLYGVVQEE